MEKQFIITTFLNASYITDQKVKTTDPENKINYLKYFEDGSLLVFTRDNNARESMSAIDYNVVQNILLTNVIEVFMVRMHQIIRGKVASIDNQDLFLKYRELTVEKGINIAKVKEVLFSEYKYIEQMVKELETTNKLEDKDYISKMARKIAEVIEQYPEKYQEYFRISYFLLCELQEEQDNA